MDTLRKNAESKYAIFTVKFILNDPFLTLMILGENQFFLLKSVGYPVLIEKRSLSKDYQQLSFIWEKFTTLRIMDYKAGVFYVKMENTLACIFSCTHISIYIFLQAYLSKYIRVYIHEKRETQCHLIVLMKYLKFWWHVCNSGDTFIPALFVDFIN